MRISDWSSDVCSSYLGKRGTGIAVAPHGTVTMEIVDRAARRIDRNLVRIDAEPVAMGVAVGKQPRLQHLVGREADARHDIGRREGSLFDLGNAILRIAVEFHHADLDRSDEHTSELQSLTRYSTPLFY